MAEILVYLWLFTIFFFYEDKVRDPNDIDSFASVDLTF